MKLCNHRDPRNGVGSCHLRVCEVSGAKWNYLSPYVFSKQGQMPSKWMSNAFECTEEMAEVCPYRVHTPIEKPEPKPKPEKCSRCGKRHYSGVSKAFCNAKDEFDRQMQPWTPEGSKQTIWSDISLDKRYRAMLWPWVAGSIFERDKWKCQDCGLETDIFKVESGTYHETFKQMARELDPNGHVLKDDYIQFEVHHIIPKGLGGSDHPTNLKLVCQNCHKKYNEKFNGEIISRRAKERRVNRIRAEVPKAIEEFG